MRKAPRYVVFKPDQSALEIGCDPNRRDAFTIARNCGEGYTVAVCRHDRIERMWDHTGRALTFVSHGGPFHGEWR